LNPVQIANQRRIYTPWYEVNNTLTYPNFSPGGEAGYGFLFNGATPQFGVDFYRHAILNNTNQNYSTINSSTVLLADEINPGRTNAYDPDLPLFQSKVGK
jgi:feruloyl esterase